MAAIHLVEDDRHLSEEIDLALSARGYAVLHSSTAEEALATGSACDVRILDRVLPDADGLDLIDRFCALGRSAPTIVVSSLGTLRDRLEGLERGADDYLAKPFAVVELVARVEALRRRSGSVPGIVLIAGPLTLNRLENEAFRGGRNLELLPRELQLLQYLMQHEGQIVTRSMLLKDVWNYTFEPKSNAIDVHMSRLRRKIEGDGEKTLIHAVRNKGYRLDTGG